MTIKPQMKKFGWRQSVVAAAFLLSLSVGIFLVLRAVRPAIYWHCRKDEPIESWMSVYVDRTYVLIANPA